MLLAAAVGDMRRFRRYSEFVYGKPSMEVFNYTLQQVRRELGDIATQNRDSLVQQAVSSLLDDLPEANDASTIDGPDKSILPVVKSQTEHDLGNILNIPDVSEKLSDEDIRQLGITDADLEKLNVKE